MSDPTLLGEEGDRPIIIQGGGSVDIFVPPTFTEQSDDSSRYDQQAGGVPKDKDFKNSERNLVSLSIDGKPPIPLSKTSRIVINLGSE